MKSHIARQASTKYLHERLLVILISRPLPAIITNHCKENPPNNTSRNGDTDRVDSVRSVEEGEHKHDQNSLEKSYDSSSADSRCEYTFFVMLAAPGTMDVHRMYEYYSTLQ